MSDNTESNASRGLRSPGYPAINLQEAIERAQKLKEYAPNRKPIPVDTALGRWGFKPKSGGGMQQVASLKKYGLLEDKGSRDQRVVILTDLAWGILTDPRPESPSKRAAIRQAALAPRINAEVRERYPHGLPNDVDFSVWLVQEKKFNEKAVPRFIQDLRATFEFAKLDEDSDETDTSEKNERVPSVGDYVQWTSQGQAQFQSPRRIERIEEYEGEKYAILKKPDGSEGGVPVSQLTVEEKPGKQQDEAGPPNWLKSPIQSEGPPEMAREGFKKEVAAIGAGVATLVWPSTLSAEEFEDLEYWLKGVLRKAKRGVDSRGSSLETNDE